MQRGPWWWAFGVFPVVRYSKHPCARLPVGTLFSMVNQEKGHHWAQLYNILFPSFQLFCSIASYFIPPALLIPSHPSHSILPVPSNPISPRSIVVTLIPTWLYLLCLRGPQRGVSTCLPSSFWCSWERNPEIRLGSEPHVPK